MILKKIYKRTSTGKIQEWEIEIQGDKYRTIVGQQNGKKHTSKWTTCKGKNTGKKNETTAEEQALKEAEAQRRLKLEADYRESVADIDDPTIWKEPLLAESFINSKTKVEIPLIYPVYIQPKLDGMRCIFTKDGAFSREGNRIFVVEHIAEVLNVIFKDFPNLQFDGELYNHEFKDDFDTLISIARKGKATPERLAEAKEKLQYHIYDLRDTSRTYLERYEIIDNLFINFGILGFVSPKGPLVKVPTIQVNNREELGEQYAKFVADGYEGAMLRLDSVYEYGRSANLLKYKDFIDEEFTLLDITEGDGNRSGMAGRFWFEKDGKRFKSNMRGNVSKYTEWWLNKDLYIGTKWTVRYQHLTPDGVPRFPVVIIQRNYE